MLHNPAALYLACHFLFKVFALTVTVICLQCLQILYKSPKSGNTKISEFFWEKQCRKITFVLLLLKHIVRFCCFHPLMCPTFIFRNAVHSGYSSSEQCCVSLFSLHLSHCAASSGASKTLWCFRPPLSRMQICTPAWTRRLHGLTACQTPPHEVLSVHLWGKKVWSIVSSVRLTLWLCLVI